MTERIGNRGGILVALALMGATTQTWAAPPGRGGAAAVEGVTVGIEVVAGSPEQARMVEDAVRAVVAASGAGAPKTVEGCKDVTFCLTVVTVPIRMGKRDEGQVVAGYVSRRLTAHPDWPWAPPTPTPASGAATSAVTIEDTFTASGNVRCAGCQSALEALQREVASARSVAAGTMADEGDLQVLIGPAGNGFLHEAASTLATALRDRHLRPWIASRREEP